jgi:hypothetical protein
VSVEGEGRRPEPRAIGARFGATAIGEKERSWRRSERQRQGQRGREREGEGERTRVTVEFNSRMFRGYGAVNLGDSIQELGQLSTREREGELPERWCWLPSFRWSPHCDRPQMTSLSTSSAELSERGAKTNERRAFRSKASQDKSASHFPLLVFAFALVFALTHDNNWVVRRSASFAHELGVSYRKRSWDRRHKKWSSHRCS